MSFMVSSLVCHPCRNVFKNNHLLLFGRSSVKTLESPGSSGRAAGRRCRVLRRTGLSTPQDTHKKHTKRSLTSATQWGADACCDPAWLTTWRCPGQSAQEMDMVSLKIASLEHQKETANTTRFFIQGQTQTCTHPKACQHLSISYLSHGFPRRRQGRCDRGILGYRAGGAAHATVPAHLGLSVETTEPRWPRWPHTPWNFQEGSSGGFRLLLQSISKERNFVRPCSSIRLWMNGTPRTSDKRACVVYEGLICVTWAVPTSQDCKAHGHDEGVMPLGLQLNSCCLCNTA